jgi:ribose 5-phosphate isomerase B
MIVGIAADHGGYELKIKLKADLENIGYEIRDFGAYSLDLDDDYPDFVIPLAQAVAKGEVNRGIAICGSGVGACIAANKIADVRAGLISDSYSAHQGVEDDDMNLLCLGARIIGYNLALELVQIFLSANYTDIERFKRRLAKITQFEKK